MPRDLEAEGRSANEIGDQQLLHPVQTVINGESWGFVTDLRQPLPAVAAAGLIGHA